MAGYENSTEAGMELERSCRRITDSGSITTPSALHSLARGKHCIRIRVPSSAQFSSLLGNPVSPELSESDYELAHSTKEPRALQSKTPRR